MRARSLASRSAVGAAALALLVVPAPAYANNFTGATGNVGCSGGNMADNGGHYFWYSALTATTAAAVNWTRTNNYDPTDVNTFNEDVLTSQTDVIVYDADYEGVTCGQTWQTGFTATGLAGFTSCESLSGSKCQQFKVYYDNDFMGPRSTGEENWLACHETGHTLGLMHTNTGAYCMQSPGIGTPALTDHDRSHLNANY